MSLRGRIPPASVARTVGPVLDVDGITHRFGDRRVLDDVGFVVRPGEVVGFVGRNGAGKTTTMRILMGVIEPDDGAVRWEGRPVTWADRLRFGYMPEERGLYPKMRCLDQLRYLAELSGMPRAASAGHAAALLDRVGLVDRHHEPVERLSLGNQQRVQLAAALLGDPAMLVLDEPFSGLDPLGVDVLADVLAEFVGRGTGVLFSSHQLDLLERLVDRVVMIDAGRIVLDEPVDREAGGPGLSDRFRARLRPTGASA